MKRPKNLPEGYDWDKCSQATQMSFAVGNLEKKVILQEGLIACLEGLLACYRLGRRPSESVLARIDKLRREISEWEPI